LSKPLLPPSILLTLLQLCIAIHLVNYIFFQYKWRSNQIQEHFLTTRNVTENLHKVDRRRETERRSDEKHEGEREEAEEEGEEGSRLTRFLLLTSLTCTDTGEETMPWINELAV
jgi:hypothetical protein